jgi:hypothetical protein
MSRWSSWLLRVAVALGSVGITLGGVEFVLREFLPIRGMIYQLNDRYLFSYIPGSRRLTNPAGEDWPKVVVRINAAGRRGDESALPHSAHRVVVYGDSFVAAEYSPESDTYVAQLERLLNESVQGTKVLNAGVSGYGVDQECLRIEDEIPSLRPDLVVVAIYAGNDYGDLLRNKLYRLDDRGQLSRNLPVIDESLRRDFRAPFELSSIQILRALQSQHEKWQQRQQQSPSADALSVHVDQTTRRLEHRRAEFEDYVVKRDNVVRNFFSDEYDADVSVEPDSPSARYRVRLMALVLEQIRRVTNQNATNLLFLIIPEQCDAGSSCEASVARHRYPGYRPSGLTDILESLARSEGVPYLNLFEAFRDGGAAMYHQIDGHWSASGQLLAAHLTANVILRSGLLRQASAKRADRIGE